MRFIIIFATLIGFNLNAHAASLTVFTYDQVSKNAKKLDDYAALILQEEGRTIRTAVELRFARNMICNYLGHFDEAISTLVDDFNVDNTIYLSSPRVLDEKTLDGIAGLLTLRHPVVGPRIALSCPSLAQLEIKSPYSDILGAGEEGRTSVSQWAQEVHKKVQDVLSSINDNGPRNH